MWIRKLQSNLSRAALWVQEGIDEIDATANLLPATREGQFDFGGLSGSDEGPIGLVDFAKDPNLRKIDDRKEVFGRIDKCAVVADPPLHPAPCHCTAAHTRALH